MTVGMKMSVAICVCAGGVCGLAGAADTPTRLERSSQLVDQVAHIYYNIATGEKIISLIGDGQTDGADSGTSQSIWSMDGPGCSVIDPGFSTSFYYVADDNSVTTSLATGVTTVDFGDLPVDTVVDCVRIDWVTDHDDSDDDSDGIGDGVVGLGGEWTWWDAENGRELNICTRTPLISFLFVDLPGDLNPSPDIATGYTADIDLGGTFASSLVFEMGDTDGDLQGAAVHNALIGTMDNDFDGLPDSDLDGDGLFDWGWSVRFYQPGTADLDGDGLIDGDIADSMHPIGLTLAYPDGVPVDNGDGTWSLPIDTTDADAAFGAEDGFAIYAPPDMNGDILHAGFFWFGGISCAPDANGQITPWAGFSAKLYGPSDPGSCCASNPADLNGDCLFNFFDVSLFLGIWSGDDCDYNGDGACNFFDISAFISDLLAGCP